ncbi:MAG: hypothetical protein JWN26_58 [Candidatus Saccharibacteria bacterium]|nr:hypothetical protein [Candidatus Saccharibacteria bacterium]
MSEIIEVDEVWYPPANILYHGDRKLREEIDNSLRKQINEMMSTAIMVIGMNKLHGENYRLQPVNPNEQTPDVRTMRIVPQKESFNILEVQEIEVVTLETHSSEGVDDFLKRTKLNSKKAYPHTTTILCHINKDLKGSKSWAEVRKALKGVGIPNDVFVLARVDPVDHKYQLVKVHPTLEFVEFNVNTELNSAPSQKVLKMTPGSVVEYRELKEEHIPFE